MVEMLEMIKKELSIDSKILFLLKQIYIYIYARNEQSFTWKWIRPYETIYQRKNRVGLGPVGTSFPFVCVWNAWLWLLDLGRAMCTLVFIDIQICNNWKHELKT